VKEWTDADRLQSMKFMEQNPSWGTGDHVDCQEIPRHIWNNSEKLITYFAGSRRERGVIARTSFWAWAFPVLHERFTKENQAILSWNKW
jgi:hypothetical protein